jgi:TonB family protein
VTKPSAAMKTGIAAAPNLDAMATPAAPRQPEIFGIDHRDVVPPVALRQAFPPLRPQWTVTAARGLVEVVIAATGAVESATVRRSIHPVYDRMLLDEARAWRYSPATRNGVAVRYRKLIEVVVQR